MAKYYRRVRVIGPISFPNVHLRCLQVFGAGLLLAGWPAHAAASVLWGT